MLPELLVRAALSLALFAVIGLGGWLSAQLFVRRDPILSQATDAEADAFRAGVRAYRAGSGRGGVRALPAGRRRWWKAGYDEAAVRGAEAALAAISASRS